MTKKSSESRINELILEKVGFFFAFLGKNVRSSGTALKSRIFLSSKIKNFKTFVDVSFELAAEVPQAARDCFAVGRPWNAADPLASRKLCCNSATVFLNVLQCSVKN